MDALGIPIDVLTQEETLLRVKTFLEDPCFHHIATVNPEFLLESEKNPEFRTALLTADLRVADGFGIVLAGLLQGKLIPRFTGADLMDEVLRIAEKNNLSVYLAIRKDGLSSFEEIKSALLKKYPLLQIDGSHVDSGDIGNRKPARPAGGLETCPSGRRAGNCAIILCNFGIPTQEIYLSKFRDKSSTLRVAMGVGGSFDYLTGKQKRAPKLLRAIGLEWLWRLIQQPKRWRRIWNAVGVFPFRIVSATIQK